ncbi:MAG: fibronectin type III domain-containing protein [Vicinamibacterales bacterium]
MRRYLAWLVVISGTQFNGLSQGAAYGDDWQSATNYPIVRITNVATGHVMFAKTHDHSSMGVATGSLVVSTTFDVPASIETGASTIEVIANGIPSAKTNISVQSAAAPGPFNKTAPANGATGQGLSVNLSWGASSGAASYAYCVDTVNNGACDTSWVSAGTATSATLNGLSTGTTYYWQVRATNGNGNTDANAGTWWSLTTASAVGAFAKSAPANGASNQQTALALSWGASANASSYSYCLDTVNNGACDTSWVSVGAATTAQISALAGGTTYYWQVRASNAAGSIDADSGTWWSFATGAKPGAFNKTSPVNAATGQSSSLTLSWGASSGVASYAYCIDTVNNATCDTSWVSVGSATSAQVSSLAAGTTYYWQVRATNGFGTTDANAGTWWSLSTLSLPAAFNKSTPANGAANQSTSPTLTWGASTGAASYEYCIDTVNDNACNTTWTTVASTSAPLSGLVVNTVYYWQVRARNTAGTTDANAGAWWTFNTQTQSLPGAFAKTSPANNATGQSNRNLTLSWAASSGAASYEYCVGTAVNSCTWTSTGTTRSVRVNLSSRTTYFWQVRARNTAGTTDANASTWWTFRTK